MSKLEHRLPQRTSIETLLIFGIGLITLILWMMPTLTGNGAPSDYLVCGAWAVLLICLLMLNYRRSLRVETQARTIYIDRSRQIFYNEKLGAVPYHSGCHLAALAGSCFAENAPSSYPKTPTEKDFELSAIIRTTSFDFQMNSNDPSFAFENMLINDWSGVIELVEPQSKFSFDSLSELEDLLCPYVQESATSAVGQCPVANTDACLRTECVIRKTQKTN